MIVILLSCACFAEDENDGKKVSYFIASLEESVTDEELEKVLKKDDLMAPSKDYETLLGTYKMGMNPYGGALMVSTSSTPGVSGVPDPYHNNLVFPDDREFKRFAEDNPLDLKNVENSVFYKCLSTAGTLLYIFEGDYNESDLFLTPITTRWELRHSGVEGR